MEAAVDEVVRRQKEAGIAVVSDGETSKISYATYVKDRYTGFAGDSPVTRQPTSSSFPPSWNASRNRAERPSIPAHVRGEVRSKGQGELGKDIANLRKRWKNMALPAAS